MDTFLFRVVVRRLPRFLKGLLRSWGRGYVSAAAALAGLLLSDNLSTLTRSPFFQPTVYATTLLYLLVAILSRQKGWGLLLRKRGAQAAAWFLDVIAFFFLGIVEKLVGLFDGVKLSYYNLMVTVAVLALLLLPSPFFMPADSNKDLEKRIPTIFDARFIVSSKHRTLSRIRRLLEEE